MCFTYGANRRLDCDIRLGFRENLAVTDNVNKIVLTWHASIPPARCPAHIIDFDIKFPYTCGEEQTS